jgi:hypothetical protein
MFNRCSGQLTLAFSSRPGAPLNLDRIMKSVGADISSRSTQWKLLEMLPTLGERHYSLAKSVFRK